jgi:very-short-patch-repair endonuclease
LRELIESSALGDDRTESELEGRFSAFVAARRLPMPRRNVPLAVDGNPIRADCVWSAQRLIVELDGRSAHSRPSAFKSDRARDQALQIPGWRVVRVTWAQLHVSPDALERDLWALLAAAPAE